MLVDDLKKHFECDSLYDVFGIASEASEAEVKKAYHKLSMQWHPDKAGKSQKEKENSTAKFQLISKAYEILSDAEKRALYDEQGSIDEDFKLTDFESALRAWRKLFKKVSEEDIDSFFTTYRGSSEEKKDIIAHYKKFDGNVDKIMNHLVGADTEEEPRILGIINQLIDEEVIEKTKDYTRTTSTRSINARKNRAKKEEKDSLAEKEKNQDNDEDGLSLEQIIRQRQDSRATVFDHLAKKYAPKRKAAKKDAPTAKKAKKGKSDN